MESHLTIVALAMGDGQERTPPKEMRIFPMGMIDTAKGPFIFDEEAAKMCMAAYSDQGNELFFDYDHRSLSEMGPPDSGKAAGWFLLELRADGLWAVNIRWTPAAAAGLSAGEWRYFSPAFLVDDNRRICALINVALTNNPATKNMTPLVAASARRASEKARKDTMNAPLLVALGLAETASDADAIAAAQSLNANAQTLSATVRDLLALTAKPNAAEALATVKAWQDSHDKLAAAQTELSSLRADNDRRQMDDLIKAGKAAGKITAANEEKVRALGSPAAVGAFLDTALPVLPANAPPAPPPAPGPATGKQWEQLTTAEKHRLFNDDRAAYDALKNDYERRANAR
jgi:phage I-like protein